MRGMIRAFVVLFITIALAHVATSASGDEVYDTYEVAFDTPSLASCRWSGTIRSITINSTERTWSYIASNDLEDEAARAAYDSANATVSGLWLFSSTTGGPVTWHGNTSYCNFTIDLVKRSYALDGYDILSLDDVIDATLEMGGNVSIWTTIMAEGGHRARVTFDVDALGFATLPYQSGAYIVPDGWRVHVVDGLSGASQHDRYLGIRGRGGVTDEDPVFDSTIEMPNMKLYGLNGTVEYSTFEPWEYGIELPMSLNVTVLTSGGLRIYMENGIADIGEIEDDISDELVHGGVDIESAIQDTFDSNGTVAVTMDEGSTAPVPYVRGSLLDQGPIIALMGSNADVGLFDEDDETLMGFFNSGGRANIETTADLSGYEYGFRFEPPDGLMADPVHGTAVGNDAIWNGTGQLNTSLWLSSVIAPGILENDTNVFIDIDMSDIALLARRMDYELNADGRIRWMLIGSDLQGGVPRNMEIEYACADLIRLMYGKGLVDEEDIDNITRDMREGLEEDSPFNSDLEIEFTGYDGEWDVDQMDGRPAVTFTIHSQGEMGLRGGENVLLNMISVPIEFELPSVEGWNTTYSILLPEGLSVAKMEVSEGEISRSSDGFKHRVTIKVPKDAESVEVKLTLNVGLMFLISQFCMCFQALLLIVVLLALFKVWRYVKERRAEKQDDELIWKGQRAKSAIVTLRAARDSELRGEVPPERPPREDRSPEESEGREERDRTPPGREGPPSEERHLDRDVPERDLVDEPPGPPPEDSEPPDVEPSEAPVESPATETPAEPTPGTEGPPPVMGRPGPQAPGPGTPGPPEGAEGPPSEETPVDEAPRRGRPPTDREDEVSSEGS